jgi:hypothetical protein
MKNTRGTPEVNAAIAKIIEKHNVDAAISLFGELSKIGGKRFRETMVRIRQVAQQQKKGQSS